MNKTYTIVGIVIALFLGLLLLRVNQDVNMITRKVDTLEKDLAAATTTQGQIVQFLNQAVAQQQPAQQPAQQQVQTPAPTQAPQATPVMTSTPTPKP